MNIYYQPNARLDGSSCTAYDEEKYKIYTSENLTRSLLGEEEEELNGE